MGKNTNRWLYSNQSIYGRRRMPEVKWDRALFNIQLNFDSTNICNDHVLMRHVGLTRGQMNERLTSGEIHNGFCTSYRDLQECKICVKFALIKSWDGIVAWLERDGGKPTYTIYSRMPKSDEESIFGIGLREGSDDFEKCYGQCIILKKLLGAQYGFKIITAYPVL